MAAVAEVWSKLDPLLSHGDFARAIELLEAALPECSTTDEICQVARKLAHLYRFGMKTKNIEKAINYAFLAGQTYVRAGRMAPSIAMLSWLNEVPEAHADCEHLRRLISETFSQTAPAKPKSADDELPVPTPYQEMKAVVSSESDDAQLLRGQWHQRTSKKAQLFSSLKAPEVERFVRASTARDLSPGAVLFREGNDARSFYIVAEGEMELTSSAGYRKILSEGDFFGEVALFGKMPRTATLTAKTSAKLLEFSEKGIQECFKDFPGIEQKVMMFYEWRLFLNVAARSLLFRDFSESDLETCWEYLTPIRVPSGRELIKQGDASRQFYFVVKGYCDVIKDGKHISRLGPGQFVGEIGLIHKTPRTASVLTVNECELLECQEAQYDELCAQFPSIRKILQDVAGMRDPEVVITEKIVID